MPRTLFNRLKNAICGKSIIIRRQDATNKDVVEPTICIIASLRIMGYDRSYDKIDKLCNISKTSARQSFVAFVIFVLEVFVSKFLRTPTEQDYDRILGVNSQRGFSECLGIWDGQNWKRKKCPAAWAGQLKRKS